ncbi:MAG: hypothetical protein K2L22_02625 [Muribaculaceae bacterium]|nr:hypothetical protein [Muribaculaceae bacterium]
MSKPLARSRKVVNHPQGVDDFKQQNRPHVADDLLKEICSIPWFHQKTIIDKSKGDTKKALFFVRKVIENSWGRDMLLNFLSTDLYERQAKAITNFSKPLPALQSDLTQQTTKAPYVFNFRTIFVMSRKWSIYSSLYLYPDQCFRFSGKTKGLAFSFSIAIHSTHRAASLSKVKRPSPPSNKAHPNTPYSTLTPILIHH